MPTNSPSTNQDIIELPQHLLKHIIDNAGSSILITDDKGIIQYANKRFYEISGYSPAETIKQTPAIVSSKKTEQAVYHDLWKTISSGNTWRKTILNKKKSGELYWCLQSILPIDSTDGLNRHYLSISEDVTELQNKNVELQQYAYQDDLTRLKNRRLFRKDVTALLKHQKQGLHALIFLDIDNFKYFNDQFGHHFGDSVLTKAANILESACYQRGNAYRLGGDEFAIILGPYNQAQEIHDKVDYILKEFEQGFEIQQTQARVTCSIGIAFFYRHGNTLSELLKSADLALYRSKLMGKQQATYYSSKHKKAHLSEYELLNDLKAALFGQELHIYGQQIVDMSTSKVHAIECLLRWHHPRNENISPIKIIDIACKHGLLTRLSHYIFDYCIEQLRPYMEAIQQAEISISINLCPQQVMDEGLIDYFHQKLLQNKIDPQLFILEITEDTKIDYHRGIKSYLTYLKDKGFKVAIDDFGSGYASFKYLYELQADYLKVDKSLLDGIEKHESKQAIVSSILSLAENLNLTTIVEGIEKMSQVQHVENLQPKTLAQGYFYHKPQLLSEIFTNLNALGSS